MFRKKWEVYRVIPQRWKDEIPQSQWMWSDSPYSRHWTAKMDETIAAMRELELLRGEG